MTRLDSDDVIIDLVDRIQEVCRLISLTSDLDRSIPEVLERIRRDAGAEFVSISLVDDDRRSLTQRWFTWHGDGSVEPAYTQPLDQGVVGQAATTGREIYLDDVSKFSGYLALAPGMQAELAVPLLHAGQVLGVLNLETRAPDGIDTYHRSLVRSTAMYVAQAIRYARLVEQQKRRMNHLRLLNRVSKIITSTVDLEELMSRIVDVIRKQLGCAVIALGLVNRDNTHVELRAASSMETLDLPIGHQQVIGEGVTGEVVRTGTSLLIPDVRSWSNYIPIHSELCSEICCPLKVGDAVFGFLDAEESEPNAFDKQDLLVMETLADHISQAIQNARNLGRINRLREDMSRMLVHDLRSPLTVISSTLQMLTFNQEHAAPEPGDSPPTAMTKYIAQSTAACAEIMNLVDDVLDLNRMETGNMPLERRETNVTELVRGVAGRLEVVARAKMISLNTRLDDQLPGVRLDPNLVSRMVKNMLSNALKFTPERGGVTLELGRADPAEVAPRLPGVQDALLLSVKDNGPGIPREAWDLIFTQFGQAELSRKHIQHGTGIGLAFCHQVIKAHGGAIWLDSVIDRGTTFFVLLPISPVSRR